jgi:hypothetical protein
VLMAYAYNPNFLGGWDWEDGSLRSVWANSLGSRLQNNQSKMNWRYSSSIEYLLCKHKTLSSNSNPLPHTHTNT